MVFDEKEYKRQWNKKNKEKIAQQKREYYQKNKDKLLQQQKEYYDTNKDKIKQYYQTPEGIKSSRIAKWKKRNVIHYDFDLLHDVIYTLTSHCDYCGIYLTSDKKRTATTKTLHHLHISNVKDNVEAIVCHSCNVKAG